MSDGHLAAASAASASAAAQERAARGAAALLLLGVAASLAAAVAPAPWRLLGCGVVLRALARAPSLRPRRASAAFGSEGTASGAFAAALLVIAVASALGPLALASQGGACAAPSQLALCSRSRGGLRQKPPGCGVSLALAAPAVTVPAGCEPSGARGPIGWAASCWDWAVLRWFRLGGEGGGEAAFGAKGASSQGNFKEDLARLGRLARHEWKTLSFGVTFLLLAAGLRTAIPQAVANTLVVALHVQGGGEAAATTASAAVGVAAAVGSAGSKPDALRTAAWHLGTLALGYGLCSGIRGLVMSIAENRLLQHLRFQTFERMLQQDIDFHDQREVGELSSRLNSDCEAVASGLSLNFNIFLRSLVQLIFGVCYLAYTSWQLSLIVLAVWGVLFYVYTVYGQFARRSSLLRQDRLAGLNSVATEALQNIRAVRAVGGEDMMVDKYAAASAELLFLEHQRAAAYGLYATFYNGLTEGIKAVALATGGALVARGAIGAKQLAASMLYVDSVVGSSMAVGGQYRQLMQAVGSSRKVFEYAEMPPSPSVVASPLARVVEIPADAFRGAVSFRNVTFTYSSRPGEPVLEGLDLEIKAGSMTALVGSSGSGKSTVAALVQRWYEPDQGLILLDGVPLPELEPRWLRSLFGVVTQDPKLFTATVWENIALGLSGSVGLQLGARTAASGDTVPMDPQELREVLNQRVLEAAEAANAHDFIRTLPKGYDTMVGDVRMSGGQRQRIALARALARRPQILVLDEATSALDRETEASVQAAISSYLKRRRATCLVITHRLSTVEDADHIVVLEHGRVAEQGTHSSLLRQRGSLYGRLVRGGQVAMAARGRGR